MECDVVRYLQNSEAHGKTTAIQSESKCWTVEKAVRKVVIFENIRSSFSVYFGQVDFAVTVVVVVAFDDYDGNDDGCQEIPVGCRQIPPGFIY